MGASFSAFRKKKEVQSFFAASVMFLKSLQFKIVQRGIFWSDIFFIPFKSIQSWDFGKQIV